MPRLSLGLGVSSPSNPPRLSVPAAAPSGIPVAGTSTIIVSNNTDPFRNWSGTYTYNSGNGHYELDLGFALQSLYWFSNANQWLIYYTNFDNSEDTFNQTASQNQNYIPTVGWPFTITDPNKIPVAGTNYVIISGALYDNGTYQKFNTGTTTNSDWILTGTVYKTPFTVEQQGTILFSPGAYIKDYNGEGTVQFGTPYNAWTLVSFSYDGENDSFPYSVVATNASTDVNYIPVNSWTNSLSVLSATQIPVGQAAQLFISFANLSQLRYNKLSNTNWAGSYSSFKFNLSWNTYTANTWVLTGDSIYNPPNILVATNPSTDSTKIPTINWSYTTGNANVVKISYV